MGSRQLELPFGKGKKMSDDRQHGPVQSKNPPPNPEKGPPAPIENPQVKVDVKPVKSAAPAAADPVKPDHAKKIEKAVEADVKKALETAKEKGAPAQIEKAKETVRQTQDNLKREGKPVVIDVKIQGTQNGKPTKDQFSVGKNDKK